MGKTHPMNSMEKPISLLETDAFFGQANPFTIYTHSQKSRVLVLFVSSFYLVIFVMFSSLLRQKLRDYEAQPEFFLNMGDAGWTRILLYGISGIAWLMAIAVLIYFIWAVVDIWGLQVCVSLSQVRVQNTISGNMFKKASGVGHLAMEDILEMKSSNFYTHLIGQGNQVRFSPVENLDLLIGTILANAKNMRIRDGK